MVPPLRTLTATGADSLFSGAEPNYLSCSGNELVTSPTCTLMATSRYVMR